MATQIHPESLPASEALSSSAPSIHNSNSLQPCTLRIKDTFITASNTTSLSIYQLSSTLETGSQSMTIYQQQPSEKPIPILQLRTPRAEAGITRSLPSGPAFVIDVLDNTLSQQLGFIQAVVDHDKTGFLKGGKGWTVFRFVPEEEQRRRGEKNVMLHKREKVLRAVAAKRGEQKGLEWMLDSEDGVKGEAVAWSSAGGSDLIVEKELGAAGSCLLVAAFIASVWQDVLDGSKASLSMADVKASLSNAPRVLGKGFGVNQYYAPDDWSNDKKKW